MIKANGIFDDEHLREMVEQSLDWVPGELAAHEEEMREYVAKVKSSPYEDHLQRACSEDFSSWFFWKMHNYNCKWMMRVKRIPEPKRDEFYRGGLLIELMDAKGLN